MKSALLRLASVALLTWPALGQTTYVWRLDAAGGAWDNAANWQVQSGPGTTFPGVAGDTAIFGNFLTAARTLTLGSPRTVGAVRFNGAEFTYTATATAANILTLDNGVGGPAVLEVDAETVEVQTLNLPLTVSDPSGLTVLNANLGGRTVLLASSTTPGVTLNLGANPLTILGSSAVLIGTGTSANLAGSGTVEVAGSLSLAGNNTGYSGQVRVQPGGRLALSPTALAGQNRTDAIVIDGGTVNSSGAVMLSTQGVSIGAGGANFFGTFTFGNAFAAAGPVSFENGSGTVNVAQTHATATFVRIGTATLGSTAGAWPNVPRVSLRGSFLLLDNTTTTLPSRLNDALLVNAQGSTLGLRNTTPALDEVIGDVNVIGLVRLRLLAFGSDDLRLTGGVLDVPAGSNVLFTGTNLDRSAAGGTARLFFSNGAALQAARVGGGGADGSTDISILPWAFATSGGNTLGSVELATASTLATYTVAGGVRALTPAEFALSVTSSTVNLRVNAGAPLAVNSPTTVNSLVLDTAGLTGASVLTLTSGTFLSLGTPTVPTNLNFGTRPAQIFNNGNLTLNGTLTTSFGLNKSGGGTLALTADNRLTLGGAITIHEGPLRLTRPEAVASSSLLRFDGPGSTATLQLNFADGLTHTFSNQIEFSNETANTITTGTTAPLSLNTMVVLNSRITTDANVAAHRGTPVTLTGDATRSNTFRLTNVANSFRGDFTVGSATVEIGSSAVLGQASNRLILLTGSNTAGGLRLTDSFTLAREVLVNSSTRVDTNGHTLHQTGPLAGTQPLAKVGAGTWRLAGSANVHIGTFAVNGGTLEVTGRLRRSTNAVTVASGATLAGGGIIDRPVTFSTGGTIAPAGTLTINANVTLDGIYACDVDGATNDRLTIQGNLDIDGATLTVAVGTPPSASSYILASYTGTRTGAFTLGAPLPAGYELFYDDLNRVILLQVPGTNHQPVAGPDVLRTPQGVAVSATVAQLVANDGDPDGNSLDLSAVSSPTASGATVTLNAGLVTYAPRPWFSGNDSFTYTLSDGAGGFATGTVQVTVLPNGSGTFRITDFALSGGTSIFQAFGIPGRSYELEFTDDLTGAWTPLGSFAADANGQLTLFDPSPLPLPPKRHYRLRGMP